ncbi:MAG: helix-turn-helix domain-containing protein [Clostridia bacterium]|nr:helix-turn-helix domain-containing protein [Clostridia bacterium]
MQTIYSYRGENIEITHAVNVSPLKESFEYHTHGLYEIYCFISGDAEYIIEDSVYSLRPGYLLIMRPGERHKIKILSDRPYERFVISFSDSVISSYDPEERFSHPFLYRPAGKNNLYFPAEFALLPPGDIIRGMCSYTDYPEDNRITSYMYILLEGIYNAFVGKSLSEGSGRSTAERMISYISEHLSEDLSLSAISERFFLSPSQINRIFKKSIGIPVGEYILTKRLTAAEDLLRSGSSALDACQRCGFRDYSAFYRSYRKHMGKSPRDVMVESELHNATTN